MPEALLIPLAGLIGALTLLVGNWLRRDLWQKPRQVQLCKRDTALLQRIAENTEAIQRDLAELKGMMRG